MQRYSRQREAILNYLKNTTAHPDAETVYNALRPDFPNLSLGTVYRNLKELTQDGTIASLGVFCDRERFDARTDTHTHAICSRCGKVIDVDEVRMPDGIVEEAAKLTDFKIETANLQFIGICAQCQNCRKE